MKSQTTLGHSDLADLLQDEAPPVDEEFPAAPTLLEGEIGRITDMRFISEPYVPEQPGQAPGYDPDSRRERVGNNRKKVGRALKDKRAKIAKASRRRNRR